MVRLNHINLAVSDVPEATRFFTEAFDFRVEERRGQGGFAVLVGEGPFVLILMHDKRVDAQTYPALFHVGFLVGSADEVRARHARIAAAGFETPAPEIVNRGGPKTFGFYCKAPGGVLVEVSTPAD
jgi:catechol 2,3-dioxygenase-like lactoylglutathione lyase family enzyme